jgi:hypothetical protein
MFVEQVVVAWGTGSISQNVTWTRDPERLLERYGLNNEYGVISEINFGSAGLHCDWNSSDIGSADQKS